MKTPHHVFSHLKMQAVFTSKNKGFSRLYGPKFNQSEMVYIYNVTCPDQEMPQPIWSHVVTMVRTTSDQQISMTFQGCFKDKLQFSRTKIYFTNRQSLTSFWNPYLLKHSILNFSAMVDHIILFYPSQQHFAKWLGMTCNCKYSDAQKFF